MQWNYPIGLGNNVDEGMGKGWGESKFGYLEHSYPIQLLSKVEHH
jgi:hypothetical protein